MGKCGTAGQATHDNIIWRIRIACCVNQSTNTHSECVILIAFPMQQWLRERTYTYSALPVFSFFSVALRPNAGHGLLIHEVSSSHTSTHHSRWDSSGHVISASQRPLPDNTQHKTDILAPGGIRTHNLSRRAAVHLRLRPRGQWVRQLSRLQPANMVTVGKTSSRDV